jgi:hypothetical protein
MTFYEKGIFINDLSKIEILFSLVVGICNQVVLVRFCMLVHWFSLNSFGMTMKPLFAVSTHFAPVPYV